MLASGTHEIELATPDVSLQIDMEAWEASIAVLAQSQQPHFRTKIQKVPQYLRNIKSNTKCFDPVLIALGPLHRSDPHLQPMNQVKAQFMQQFAAESQVSFQQLYDKVVSVLEQAKDSYVTSALDGLSDTEFCQMMCLDGCFVLQFLLMISQPGSSPLTIESMPISRIVLVLRDLFLLENQIPLFILQVLMSLRSNTYDELIKILNKLMEWEPLPLETRVCTPEPLYNDVGLLFIWRPPHILALSRMMTLNRPGCIPELEPPLPPVTQMYPYRSASNLWASGIHFKRDDYPLLDLISFNSFLWRGILTLPPLTVTTRTKTKLLNMAAYEACFTGTQEIQVTSYLCFMNELINQAEDVTLLTSNGVLSNHLGSDQQVADLFNEITNGLVPKPDAYSYKDLRERIEAHYKKKSHVWLAQLRETHLASPWKVIGLLAASTVIILTSIQAWYAANPPK